MRTDGAGFEYEVVGFCKKTGKPFVAPKAWSVKRDRPWYPTCACCGKR
jgi:hypothetical protein